MKGAAVCHKHGGSAPQVRRKAAERIANAADVAVLQIMALMQNPDTPAQIKLAAAKDLLDRADVTGKTKIEVEAKAPWEVLLDGIVAELPTGADGMRAYPALDQTMDEPPLAVVAERVDDYAPSNADWSHPVSHGADLPPVPDPTAPRHVQPTTRQPPEPDAPPRYANGDDTPPPPRYAPTYSGPRRGRGRSH